MIFMPIWLFLVCFVGLVGIAFIALLGWIHSDIVIVEERSEKNAAQKRITKLEEESSHYRGDEIIRIANEYNEQSLKEEEKDKESGADVQM